MDYKEYYTKPNTMDTLDFLQVIITSIKILIGGCLLILGIYLTLWSVGILEQFISQPETVPLVNSIISSGGEQNVLKIFNNGQEIIIENGDLLKWFVLIIIILIIFNVIGRAIAAIFQCVLSLFNNLDVKSFTQKNSQKNLSDDKQDDTNSYEKFMEPSS